MVLRVLHTLFNQKKNNLPFPQLITTITVKKNIWIFIFVYSTPPRAQIRVFNTSENLEFFVIDNFT